MPDQGKLLKKHNILCNFNIAIVCAKKFSGPKRERIRSVCVFALCST